MNPEELEVARKAFKEKLELTPDLNYDGINQAMLQSGLWTRDEIVAEEAEQREAEAKFDADMRDSLLAVQEADANREAGDTIMSGVLDSRIDNMALTEQELAEELKANADIHNIGAALGTNTVNIEGKTSIFGEDEITISKEVRSAQVNAGRGIDTIISEAPYNNINAGKGDDAIAITSYADTLISPATHILDGGPGTDHYTVNLNGKETAYHDFSNGKTYVNERDNTIITDFERGETLTLNFNPERMLIEGVNPEVLSAGQLLAQANISIAGDFPTGMSVDCKPVQDVGVQSCTITRDR